MQVNESTLLMRKDIVMECIASVKADAIQITLLMIKLNFNDQGIKNMLEEDALDRFEIYKKYGSIKAENLDYFSALDEISVYKSKYEPIYSALRALLSAKEKIAA